MMKYTTLIVLVFTTTICWGQSGGQTASGAGAPPNQVSTGLIASNNRFGSIVNQGFIPYEEVVKEYENIDGSPYLYGDEIIVDLKMINDSILTNVSLRYDQYNNELIAQNEQGEEGITVLDQRYYKSFQYDNDGNLETYMRLDPNDNTYYQVLFQADDFVFCKANEVKLIKSSRHVPGVDLPAQSFSQRAEYFVLINRIFSPVKLRNGEAISFFPKVYADQVPSLQKALRIRKLRNEGDYLQIIEAFEHPEKL